MEKLKVESCIERARKTDQELEFFSTGGSQLAQSDINKSSLAETSNKTFTKFYNLSNRKLNDIEKMSC